MNKEYRWDKLETQYPLEFPSSEEQAACLSFRLANGQYVRTLSLQMVLEACAKYEHWRASVGSFKILALSLKILFNIPGQAESPLGIVSFWPGDVINEHANDPYNRSITANHNIQFSGRETQLIKKYISCRTCGLWINQNTTNTMGVIGCLSSNSTDTEQIGEGHAGYGGRIIITLYVIGKSRLL